MNTTTAKEEIFTTLQKISKETTKDFYDLGNNFPILIRELDLVGKQGKNENKSIKAFTLLKSELLNLVDDQKKLLHKNSKFLEDFKTKNDTLFTGFSNRIDILDNITGIINEIKDCSMEMEVISLNAMVVSIKSGKAGQAFSYITSNLKQLSLSLINQSDMLMKSGVLVQNAITRLNNEIKAADNLDIRSSERNASTSSGIINATDRISRKLEQMTESTTIVRNPILKAMEGIQLQDIIRQSLEDILLAVNKIKLPEPELPPEQKIEQLNANCKLALLSNRCLNNIKKDLQTSIDTFSTNLDSVSNTLSSIDSVRVTFLKQDNNTESELGQLTLSIQNTIGDFNDFASLISSYQNIQGRILSAVQNIQMVVQSMYSCFSGFQSIIGSLQYVALAQRIEVAKNTAISSIKDTVEHMSDLILQTNNNVDTAQKELQTLSDSSNTLIKDYLSTSTEDQKKFTQASLEKADYAKNLTGVETNLGEALRQFNVYSPDFYKSYNIITNTIDKLKTYSRSLDRTSKDLELLQEVNENEKKKLIQTTGVSDSGIHNENLLGFINHFTITADKQEAGKLTGITIEKGAESGEITFF